MKLVIHQSTHKVLEADFEPGTQIEVTGWNHCVTGEKKLGDSRPPIIIAETKEESK
jgi:hypothetical protein